jgi:hypothetical protein
MIGDAVTYYKLLAEDGSACNGGSGRWHLPTADGPGEWMPCIANPEPCARGYHLVMFDHILEWHGAALFVAEADGNIVADTDKVAVETARLIRRVKAWNKTNLRLFAADCAEHVLHLFETAHPNDDRPRKAIAAARAFARGEINDAARVAARVAARAAARAAAGDAARAAAWAAAAAASADACVAAWDAAAWVAARAAAWAAARDAAAWDAERKWQNALLAHTLGVSR